jgi:hypothetical protein
VILNDYILKINPSILHDAQIEATLIGKCATISALQVLRIFGIEISAEEVKEGVQDDDINANQVNMAVFMSSFLNITYCVNYDLEEEIDKAENGVESLIDQSELKVFKKLLGRNINFQITPPLNQLIDTLNQDMTVSQFNFREPSALINHFAVLQKVTNNKLRFAQRECEPGNEYIDVDEFLTWWNLSGAPNDPHELVILYSRKI